MSFQFHQLHNQHNAYVKKWKIPCPYCKAGSIPLIDSLVGTGPVCPSCKSRNIKLSKEENLEILYLCLECKSRWKYDEDKLVMLSGEGLIIDL